MIKVFLVNLLLFLLSCHALSQQKFDPSLLESPEQNGVFIAEQLRTIDIAIYPIKQDGAVYLRNGFRSERFLNESDWLTIKDTVECYKIDIVYSKFPLRKGVYHEIHPLLFGRIKAILGMDSSLNQSNFEWNKVRQTEWASEKEANALFHGVVIHYRLKSIPLAQIDDAAPPISNNIEPEEYELDHFTREEFTEFITQTEQLSYLPDSVKLSLQDQPLKRKMELLSDYFEKAIHTDAPTDLKTASPSEIKALLKRVTEFGNTYSSSDNIVSKVLDRHPEWTRILVVNDWTGSMYNYGAQVLEWHIRNHETSGIHSITLFNDGDRKSGKKEIGTTGGIYMDSADDINRMINLFHYVSLQGNGGDGPENDIEAILHTLERDSVPYTEIVLIADNNACVRDIFLSDRIQQPVRIILCGYRPGQGIHPHYIYLAKKTNGGIYTIEDDIEDLRVGILTSGAGIKNSDDRFKIKKDLCHYDRFEYFETRVFTEIKEAKKVKQEVRKIDLSNQELHRIPAAVYKMPSLDLLNLSNNTIRHLPAKMGGFANLRELDLSDNIIADIPETFRDMRFIRIIDLSGNQLTVFSSNFCHLKYLEHLDLSNNHITQLPKNARL